MKKSIAILLFLSALGMLCGETDCRARAVRETRELRGFWVDGFNEGYKTQEQIDLLLQRVRQAHCNAVFAQMRKGGDAYYMSRYEPPAADLPPAFDALATLIQKAHALRPPIAVHAWLNVCAVGKNRLNLPGHISTLHPDWLSRNVRGSSRDPEAAKIDPGCPDAADWTFRVFLDVVRHYDVDGIHLDFVRYTERSWGYNPVSLARFRSRLQTSPLHRPPAPDFGGGSHPPTPSLASERGGATDVYRRGPPESGARGRVSPNLRTRGRTPALPSPTDPVWKQWRRDQVTALVRKIYVQAVALKPKLVVSAALIAWSNGPRSDAEWNDRSAAMNRVFQDWRSWLREGILDLGCPMTYFSARYARREQLEWNAWIKSRQYGRAAAIGIACWENSIPETIQLLSDARRRDAQGRRPYGVMLYSYAGTNLSGPRLQTIGYSPSQTPHGPTPKPGGRRELQYQPEFYAALGQPSAYAPKPPFPSDASPPPMPWKTHPTTGHLMGFVLTPDLHPVDGALVEISDASGRLRRQRTDGTGFYAFIDLNPLKRNRAYTIRVRDLNGEAIERKAQIVVGHATTQNFILSKSTYPIHEGLLVVLGSDTDPGNLYATDAKGAGIRIRLAAPPLMPFQPGDVISAVGASKEIEGEPTLDQATAVLTGLAPVSALPAPRPVPFTLLAHGAAQTGEAVQVTGTVEAADAQGFLMQAEGARVRTPLAGRKEFPITSRRLEVAPLVPGERVKVTGIVSRLARPDARQVQILLLPRSGEDVVVLSLPRPSARFVWAQWLTVLLTTAVAVLLLLWFHKKRLGMADKSSV